METKGIAGLNLNALQTYLSGILAAVPIILANVGCTVDANGVTSCASSVFPWLTATVVAYIAGITSVLKFIVIPAIQPGGWFRNLFEPKVPVSTTPVAGTVAPEQVKK